MTKRLIKYWVIIILPLAALALIFYLFSKADKRPGQAVAIHDGQFNYWKPPVLNFDTVTTDATLKSIIYGHELIKNTSRYFGPSGSISKTSNGMNCQNCHLESGTKAWGNNYGAVASTYPKFRPRSGTVESISKRVNDCFLRSLNGKTIDTSGYEMKSIVSFIKWAGKDVQKGVKPLGTGIVDLMYLDRAASPGKGQLIYTQKCRSCHGENGQGTLNINGIGYIYPPLWGDHSYNTGAGLFRLSRFAGFVKDNMPFGLATHNSPTLTDEEAWDVGAFVNSQPRPGGDIKKDWPDIAAKPVDNPFGPYKDSFSEEQHKYGPFKPIAAKRKGKPDLQINYLHLRFFLIIKQQ